MAIIAVTVSAVDRHSITMIAVIGDRQDSSGEYFYKTRINRFTGDTFHQTSQLHKTC
jgi:hypothetical protein